MTPVQTEVITNFRGNLTDFKDGDLNSGLCKYSSSFGYEPFGKPGILRWSERPIQIDSAGTIITDLVLHQKGRVESGSNFVYAADYSGRFYKITVSTDTPVLQGTIPASATLKYGGGLEFFTGATEKAWIGNDTGLSKINFDGTSPTAISTGVTWVANIPRPIAQFVGKLYVGNDTNIVEIDNTETVSNGAKFTTALPANWHIRDFSVTPDGAYLIILATRLAVSDLETVNPVDISSTSDSAVFYWNGSDPTYSSFQIYPNFIGTALNTSSGDTYITGYVLEGAILRKNSIMVRDFVDAYSPTPGSFSFNGNQPGWTVAENDGTTTMKASLFIYGVGDEERGNMFVRTMKMAASGTNTDVQIVGSHIIASNTTFQTGSAVPIAGAKIYFSTYETGGTAKAKFYKTLLADSGGGNMALGVYETQNKLYSKRVQPVATRFYVEPTAANNGFQMDLIGIDGLVLTGSTKNYTFASGTDPLKLQGALTLIEFANLQVAPTSSLGLRVTNTGTINMHIHKVEVDYVQSGR